MAELSPHLNSNPIDRAFALGAVHRNLQVSTGRVLEIIISVGGRAVYSSGAIREESLINLHQEFSLTVRKGEKIKGYLHVLSFLQGYPYWAAFPYWIETPPPRNGQVRLVLTGSAVQSSRAMRLSRSWSANLNSQYRGAKLSVPRSTAPRPSPEFWYRPFLKTFEFGDPASFQSFPSIVSTLAYFRGWTGTTTPGFGSKKRRALPDNPYFAVIAEVGQDKWSWYQTRSANGSFSLEITTFTEKLAVPTAPYTHITDADEQAISRLITNAQTGMQANLAVNIAQVNQLTGMIAQNVSAIIKSIRFLRRGNIPAAVSQLRAGRLDPRWQGGKGFPSAKKTVANNWLQLQYGWKPLLSDIEGSLKTIGTVFDPNSFVQRARGSARQTRVVEVALPDTTSYTGVNSGKTIFTFQTTCKYNVRFRMDNPISAFLGQTGISNPINLGWELIPFSFVFDWFLPIGNYLESLSAWKGYTFLGGSKVLFTRKKTDSTVAYSGGHPADPANVNVLNYGSYHQEDVYFSRAVLSDFPSPSFPSPKWPITGVNRAANAIALLMNIRTR